MFYNVPLSLRSRVQLQSFNVRGSKLDGIEVRLRQHHALLQKHVFKGNNNNSCYNCNKKYQQHNKIVKKINKMAIIFVLEPLETYLTLDLDNFQICN